MKEIAVLIPVFNNQEGLIRSIESIVDDKVNYDIVIVDDGSKNEINLPENLLKNQKVIILRSIENKGISYALNMGLDFLIEEGYKYIARMDAGDVCLPGRLFEQHKYLHDNNEYMMVGANVEFIDGFGKILYYYALPNDYQKIRRKMHIYNCFIHPAVMFKTSIVKEIGKYSHDYTDAEDYEYFFRIINKYKATNINSYFIRKEITHNSISSMKRNQQMISKIKIQRKYFNLLLPESYIGILWSLALFKIPMNHLMKIKKLIWKNKVNLNKLCG
jgi:glycosyltransferase involved in cell wall biosynthesis